MNQRMHDLGIALQRDEAESGNELNGRIHSDPDEVLARNEFAPEVFAPINKVAVL